MSVTGPPRQLTEVRCRTLFDGERIVDDAIVTIDGDTIVSVGRAGGLEAAADESESSDSTVEVDFAMPGMIDCHAHCIGDGNLVRLGSEASVSGDSADDGEHHDARSQVEALLSLYLTAGVTAVRDVGSHLSNVEYARAVSPDETHPRRAAGPRIAAAGPLLGDHPMIWRFTEIVGSEQEAEAAVQGLADQGVDLVAAYRGLDESRLAIVVEAARRHDLPVSHTSLTIGAEVAAEMGVASVEHAAYLLDEQRRSGVDSRSLLRTWAGVELSDPYYDLLRDRLLDNEVVVVPTLVVARRSEFLDEVVSEPSLDLMIPVMPFHRYFKRMRSAIGWRIGQRYVNKYAFYGELSRQERAAMEFGYRQLGEFVCRLLDSGVQMALGTDSPHPSVVPGYGVHAELRHLVDVGVAPLTALTMATSAAADLMGRSDLGRVRSGAKADLALFDASPLDGMVKLDTLRDVVLGGMPIDRVNLLDRLAAEAERYNSGEGERLAS